LRLGNEVLLLRGAGEALPFSGGLFDAVALSGVIHHLISPDDVFHEIQRVLKPGGYLFILEGNPTSFYRSVVLRIADLLGIIHEASTFPHLSAREITTLMPVGMQVIRTDYVSGFFAPLALSGLGGKYVWAALEWIEDRIVPASLSKWYNFLVLHKLT